MSMKHVPDPYAGVRWTVRVVVGGGALLAPCVALLAHAVTGGVPPLDRVAVGMVGGAGVAGVGLSVAAALSSRLAEDEAKVVVRQSVLWVAAWVVVGLLLRAAVRGGGV